MSGNAHPNLTLIAAMDRNNVIGQQQGMPWHLPADFAFFKQQTMGKHLLMGRKTFESIGKPLPGRTTVILSKSMDVAPQGTILIHSLAQLASITKEEIMVAGGGQIYQQTIEQAHRLLITKIDATIESGDTYFPEIDQDIWKCEDSDFREKDEKNCFDMTFERWSRR